MTRPWPFLAPGKARNFAYWCIRRRSIRYMWVLRNGKPSINMVRYYIFKSKLFEIYIHQFIDADDDVMHDHPWSFLTLVLAGGYLEELEDGGSRWLSAGRIVYRKASHTHRVVIPQHLRGAVWTLVLTGPRSRKWTFFDKSERRRLSPAEFGQKRGAELRTDVDFRITTGFFPSLKNGRTAPRVIRLDS